MEPEELFNREASEIFKATDRELDEALKKLANPSIMNQKIITEPVVRALIINTIKNQRHIDKIEARNQIYTYVIIGLSVAAIIAQLLPIFIKSCK